MKAYILLTMIALTGCDRNANEPAGLTIDAGLRGLHSVGSLHGSFQAPKDGGIYILTTLEFEDGKLARRGSTLSGDTKFLGGRSSSAQFLWGMHEGKNRTALVGPGTVSRAENDFWTNIAATTNSPGLTNPEHQGYTILGMGQSDETRAGIADMGFGSDLDRALKEKMYVGVLVVRFFTSEREKEEFMASSPRL